MAYNNLFDELKQAGLDVIHEQVGMAMDVYYKDPTQCCLRFRYALEAVLLTVYELANQNPPTTNKERIVFLGKLVSEKYLPKELIQEMHVLRKVTNRYHHFPLDLYNPEKDRLTCKCTMEPISEWIVDLSANPKTWARKDKLLSLDVGISLASLISAGVGYGDFVDYCDNKADIRELFKKRLLELDEYDE